MSEANRQRAARASIPVEAVTVEGTIPIADISKRIGLRTRLGERRWQALGEQVIAAAEKGEAVIVRLGVGHRPDIVRAGLSEELSRKGYKSRTTGVSNDDGTITLYLFGDKQPPDANPAE